MFKRALYTVNCAVFKKSLICLSCITTVFSLSGTVQDVSVMEEFLRDSKNYFADKQSTVFESMDASCELLQKIKNEFNSGLLVEIQHRFFRLSKAFADKQIGEFALSDLRFLNDRIDKFNRFIEKFVDKNKARLTPEELELLDNLEKFCSILKNVLKEENFDIDALDKIVDKVATQPAHFVANNPGVAAIMATPFALYGLYRLTYEKEEPRNKYVPGESQIGSDGFYVPTPVHINGIPDGVYSEVNVASQERYDCGAAATARTLQKILRIPDDQTVAFRKQKYLEWDPFYREILKNLLGSPDYQKDIQYKLNQPKGSPILFNWMLSSPCLSMLIEDVNKSIENSKNKIIWVNYYWLVEKAQKWCKAPSKRRGPGLEYKNECLSYHADGLINFRDDAQYPVETSMHVVCGPIYIRNYIKGDDGSHYLYYELKKIAPAGSPGIWFTICCEDTLKLYVRRRLGAYMLYNLLSSDELSWGTKLPDITDL